MMKGSLLDNFTWYETNVSTMQMLQSSIGATEKSLHSPQYMLREREREREGQARCNGWWVSVGGVLEGDMEDAGKMTLGHL